MSKAVLRQFFAGFAPARLGCLLWLGAIVTVLAGCVGVPQHSAPMHVEAVQPFERNSVPFPTESANPETVVRGFLKASAYPQNNYQAAKKYLTPAGKNKWVRTEPIKVISPSIDVFLGLRNGDDQQVSVRTSLIGTLDRIGHFENMTAQATYSLGMHQVAPNTWRIDSLPPNFGVVIDQSQFTINYHSYSVYFLSKISHQLTPDVRWLNCDKSTAASCLTDAIVQGPASYLASSVHDVFSVIPKPQSGNIFTEQNNGVQVNFSDMAHVDPDEAKILVSQLVWTFNDAGLEKPYRLSAANVPLLSGFGHPLTVDDVVQYNPHKNNKHPLGMHALIDGRLWRAGENSLTRVQWEVDPGPLDSVSLGQLATVAAVTGTDEGNVKLLVGDYGKRLTAVGSLSGVNTISKPNWSVDDSQLWFVLDGKSIIRANVKPVGVSVRTNLLHKVELRGLTPQDGDISVLRISPDGTRVAFIDDGNPYVGVISEADNKVSISHIVPLESHQLHQATVLTWISATQIIVGGTNASAPIKEYSIDGLDSFDYPGTNLTVPIMGVYHYNSTTYTLDSRTVWRLDNNHIGESWQEDTLFISQEQAGQVVMPVFQE